ncbi:MAG: amino acid adenylation domain-containing protein [Acidimicrobiales bacterium]|jgi:amino acid adenylation domain-containing protein
MSNYSQATEQPMYDAGLGGKHFDTLGVVKNVSDIYPLVPTQEGMLYHALREPDPELYFEQVRCDLVGPLDQERFKAVWAAVFAEHPALRTAFVWSGVSSPVQVVRETVTLPWVECSVVQSAGSGEATDWDRERDRERDRDRDALELDEIARRNRAEGFDLQRAPVSRFTLVAISDERSHFIWDFHHILLDGWSATMVFDEALRRYNAPGAPESETGTSPPFRNYVEWLAKQDNASAERYWTGLLAEHHGAPEIKLSAPDAAATNEPARLERTIDRVDVEPLQAFARANRVTLNSLVQGAWAAALGRFSGANDVTFGVVTSGRPADLAGVEDTVGMFLSALPMRLNTDDDSPMTEWLQAILRQQLDSIEHQHAALADMHRWARLPAGQSLFDSVLVFENFPTAQPASDPSLAVADKTVFEQTHYGLTVMVRPDDHLHLATLFDPLRLSAADVADIIELFVTILRAIPTATAGPRQLPLTTEADEAALRQVNATGASLDNDTTMLALLQDAAAANPDGLALVQHSSVGHHEARISFAELMEGAQLVAHGLNLAGIKSGDAVGVSLPRSIDQVVALLGIWTAGAAYVPIDPDHPATRQTQLQNRAGVEVLLTPDRLAEVVRAGQSAGNAPVADTIGRKVDPDGAACIIFTSGSTGLPKPVEIHHRGIINRCRWQLSAFPMTDDEVCLAKTTLNFVDHLWELWGPLIAGRKVVLLDDADVTDPNLFAAAVARHKIRRITLVPSLLDVLLDDLALAQTALRWITVSGETLSRRLADRVADQLRGVSLLNFYGMSECTADATWCEITADAAVASGGSVSIGRPLANMTVDVLDKQGRPVPVGVEGEIFVGGAGLATGYRGSPELTEADFVFLADSPDGTRRRMYRTGDLGRWNRCDESLQLSYLGRRDRQLKIRGVRVEPSEIEGELARHPLVREVVVSSVGDDTRRQLVAHVVPVDTDDAIDPPTILDWARDNLPTALVPSRLFVLERLPLLPTGKVDRGALAELDRDPQQEPQQDPRKEPRRATATTEVEKTMVGLWQDVLESAHAIGLDDDFFLIGGDSLLAVRLFSRIDREYSRDLALAEVFDAPTPRAMLDLLGLGESSTSSSAKPLYLLRATGSPHESSPFETLSRRLAGSANVVEIEVGNEVEATAALVRTANGSTGDAIDLLAHGEEAAHAIRVARRLAAAGSTVGLVAIIDGAVQHSDVDAVDTRLAAQLVFFEPSETDGKVPLLLAPELKSRLDDRSRWSPVATKVDTVVVPGTPDNLLLEPNVSWLAHLIEERLESEGWRYLVPISDPEGANRRLFAVHGEYGNVVGYRDLAVALGDTWSVVGIQASGVHGTQPLHRSIEEMAEAYIEEMLQMQPAGPYLIGGYSAGGTVAYEMTQRLIAEGHDVLPMVWFDHYKLGAVREESRSHQLLRVISGRAKALADPQALREGLTRREIRRKVNLIAADGSDDDEWWWAITKVAKDRAEAENLRGLKLRDNIRGARSRYDHAPYSAQIVLYEAHVIDAWREPDRGWSDHSYRLERVPVPGDHSSLLLAPNVEAIAADLRQRFPAPTSGAATTDQDI